MSQATGTGAAGTGAKANVVKAYAATSAKSPLGPWQFERREVGPLDVQIEILYCGVCHSDLHMVRDEWGGATYPVVPLARGQAVSIALTSYDGGVYFGLNADRDAMSDVDVLAQCITDSLVELRDTVR